MASSTYEFNPDSDFQITECTNLWYYELTHASCCS